MLEIKKCVNDSHAFIPQSKFDKYGIHSNNAIVQDMGSNLNMQKGGKEQSGFSKNFQKYCASFDNYLNQRDELIVNKIEGNEPSQIARLSLINLIDVLDELPAMQMAFEQEFGLKDFSIDCNDEYQQLLTLSGDGLIFMLIHFTLKKTVAYSQKEYIKKYRRRIDDFFQVGIAQYEGVISVQFVDRTIVVIVEVEKVDSFCSQIFDDMKEAFPEVATLTLEGFLWSEYVD